MLQPRTKRKSHARKFVFQGMVIILVFQLIVIRRATPYLRD
jgi:hypothetical protein